MSDDWDLHRILAGIARHYPVKRYLEIGVGSGASLQAVLDTGIELTRISLIDNWCNKYGGTPERRDYTHIGPLLRDYHGEKDLLSMDSGAALPMLKGRQYDLILVDGDHSFDGAWNDLHWAAKLVAPKGFIVFHDTNNPDHQYLEHCGKEFGRVHPKLRLVVESWLGNGLMVFQKSGDT